MKNITVLVSGGGTNLQALIDAQESGIIKNGRITCVISSKPGVYALERAKNHGIKSRVLERKLYRDSVEYSRALLKALDEEKADLVVYAGFMTIIDELVVKAYPNRMMNVHPALIPSFCGKGYYGLHVHEKVLERGAKVTGATVHFVDEDLDHGPILIQKAVDVKEGDTPQILQRRVMEEAEWILLPRAISLIAQGRVTIDDNGLTHISDE